MNPSEEKVVDAMLKYGGSFVKALAEAYIRGDIHNRRKIRETWSNYWEEYQKMAQ